MKALVRFLLLPALLLAVLSTTTTSATAQTLWERRELLNNYKIDGDGNRYCLDADLNTWEQNGGKVQAWICLRDNEGPQWNQVWYAFWGDRSRIRTPGAPFGPAKCLDALQDHRYLWGYRVSVRECSESGLGQTWETNYNNTGQIRNLQYGNCLDTDLAAGNGSYVGLFPCRQEVVKPRDTQIWHQVYIG